MVFVIARRVGHTNFYWDADTGRFVPNPLQASLYQSAYVAACVAGALNATVVRYVTAAGKPAESP